MTDVADLFRTALAAVGLFAGTNVDDLVVLTTLFLAARARGRPRAVQIWAGQALGIGALVAASGAVALGLAVVPDAWVRWLGVVPLGLGVRAAWIALRSRGAGPGGGEPAAVATSVGAIAAVTVADGGDNLAVYVPAFRVLGVAGTVVTVAVFALGVVVWCLAASWLGSHRRVVGAVERWGHWLVPAVFVTIGVVVLAGAG